MPHDLGRDVAENPHIPFEQLQPRLIRPLADTTCEHDKSRAGQIGIRPRSHARWWAKRRGVQNVL